ncbi:MAG: YHS domain-containing protein [Ignavibacteria bacterium]|nr:YHS domain-containing protein [Ignavibacteria bacterium]
MKVKIFAMMLFSVMFVFAITAVNAQEKECCTNKTTSECSTAKTESSSECSTSKTETTSNCCSEKSGNSSGVVVSDSAKLCPVSGEPVDHEGASVKYTYLGKEYEFCCGGCLKKFKAEPVKYIKTELTCPVMGEPIDKEVFTVVDGVKYYFCCPSCIKKFEKDPQKYLNKSN